MPKNSVKARNYDRESEKDRVKVSKKKQPVQQDSESEPVYSDSELESELDMPAKDDTVRPKPKNKKKSKRAQKPSRVADHGVEGEEDSGNELADEIASKNNSAIAPHMQMLLAATYHVAISSIVRPGVSNYIPSCNALFSMAYAMMELVSENTYLHEMCPASFSVGFYCYVGYLYFYQILRAKDEVGRNQLSRAERRALRSLKTVGEPEAWPVPAPLIAFIQALGYYKSTNPVYSYVVPSLPDFSHVSRAAGNTTAVGYTNLHAVAGIQRVPPVSAYMEFLRLFGLNTSVYSATHGWVPQAGATLAANRTFMGLADSTAANGNSFQTLAFSDGWNSPTEGQMNYGVMQASQKRNTIRRWSVPARNNLNIDSIETFIGVEDGTSTQWIHQLINQASILTRFFPGSTNLSAISPICNLGSLTPIKVSVGTARVPRDDGWYRGRQGWKFEYRVYDDTEQGRILSRIGIATGTNAHFTASVTPVGTRTTGRQGPFFFDDATNGETERFEVFRAEGETESDPAGRFGEQLSSLYNATGR
uniref:Capsid protein n=1 Tax=Rosellinia necatrix partitivirus 12 TaxID=2699380 RepID=A0A6F8QGV7_9VIRU|nr:capsid protein [Rosellinia necatrix partitivirus 12]